jgi:hypothetical protein
LIFTDGLWVFQLLFYLPVSSRECRRFTQVFAYVFRADIVGKAKRNKIVKIGALIISARARSRTFSAYFSIID